MATRLVLMDVNRGQESVRYMRCILLDLPATTVQAVAGDDRVTTTRRGQVSYFVDLLFITCGQRVPVYRASLVRQT